jgi:hypothetical protein
MKTFDDAYSDSSKIWIKQTYTPSETGPYSLQQFELNCDARQIRAVSLANYDASGEFMGNRDGGEWGSVVPDTLAETLFSGMCRSGGN